MFRLLGPLEFFDGRNWTQIRAAKQRALLAVLLINANHAVSLDQLIAELWGERPPASAAGLLAGYVWRLRRCLSDPDGRVLATRAPGYQLVVPPGSVDVHEYEAMVAAGRRGLADGDLAGGADTLSAALAMWRGAPLSDVALVPSVLAESARLEEARLAVVEARIGAEIGLGRHEALLPELKLMVSQFPLRERLHAHLMVALYRTGQQAEALGAYRDLRQLLIEELGIEPSKPLRELQGRILREDPSLIETAAKTVVQLSVPRALPPDVPVFVGRERELERLAERLGNQRHCAIHGMAGVGKTALAVHAAHLVADHFPDGQIYLDLGATGTQVSPTEAIGQLLNALGVAAAPDEALLRTTFAGRRVLLVLDNVLDTGQIRGLLPATPGSAAIIAGRSATTMVDGSGLIHLSRLSASEAARLLERYAGRSDTGEIAQLCDNLPLALRIAAARLAQRPEWTVSDFARRLADPRRRLTALSCDGLSVSESVRAGARLFGDSARVLGLLGDLDLPVLHTEALAVLLGESDDAAERIAERLVDAGLIETVSFGRYRVPDLVRLFARSEYPTPTVEPGNIGGTTAAMKVEL